MTLSIIGIIISFIGSIILAFSVSKNPGNAHQLINGKKRYLAIIKLRLFRWGVILIAIGFFLQILKPITEILIL